MGKHGNLSKAGKVRKQTKKVEKQKVVIKPPRGRANMRRKFKKRQIMAKNPRAKFNTNKVEEGK